MTRKTDSRKNDPKNQFFRGLKLRGNEVSGIFGHFDQKSPTQISATHSFSKIRRKFQNQVPKESDQNIDIPSINIIDRFNSNFQNKKKSILEKSYDDFFSRNST